MRAHAVHSLERRRRHLLAVIVSAHRQYRRVLDPLLLHADVCHTQARAALFAAAQLTADDQFPPPPPRRRL